MGNPGAAADSGLGGTFSHLSWRQIWTWKPAGSTGIERCSWITKIRINMVCNDGILARHLCRSSNDR
eukprot:11377489-Prorocentrum_lima.AAC.1